jgi:hypothetical protein
MYHSIILKIIAAIPIVTLLSFNIVTAQEVVIPQRVSVWENVTGFDINTNGTYMVLSMRVIGREVLYESRHDGNQWSSPSPIESINNYGSSQANIGGASLYFNEKVLYFHANYPIGEGGYDIYYSEREANGWSEPKKIGAPINTPADEFFPTMPPGEQKLFFSRKNPNPDLRKASRAPDCQMFYVAHKNPSGSWETPKPLHDAINQGCPYGINVTNDGKTIFFSSVDQVNYKDGYNIYFAREIMPGSWLLPTLINGAVSETTNINPRVVGNDLYFIMQTESRRETTGVIYKIPLPDQYKPLNTIKSKGAVIQLETKTPLNTPLKVFDPITLNVLGEYSTDPNTGSFEINLLDNANYIIDIREKGYSFASFQVDYRQDKKVFSPELIQLFNEIELDVSVYDSEIFRPREAVVWVEVLSDKNRRIDAVNKGAGVFTLKLPIGHNYKINAIAKGFEENSFEFNLYGDIIFSRFERNLPLEPRKKAFEILISDNETNALVNAEITFKNLNRDEVISFVTAIEAEENDVAEDELLALDEKDLMQIPYKNASNPYRFALVIGNEDYKSYQVGLQSESNVDFAIRDASLFKEYAHKVLGVPQENIMFLINARAIEMYGELKRLSDIIRSLNGKAEVFFYYAGHGFPDQASREPYIIPVDVSGSSLKFGLKLTDLYQTLSEHPSQRITVFLDACFTGGARNVGLVSARAVRLRPKEEPFSGNLVVFSATSENQTAHPYKEMQHGIFTYYALKKMRETRGNITYEEYSDYLRETVGVRSILVNYAEQTPQTNVSRSVEDKWQKWKFR